MASSTAAVPSSVALSLSSAPQYDQKNQHFIIHGILDNASNLPLDNVSVQLMRSSRIDRVADLPSEQSHWDFSPQFISAPIEVKNPVSAHSRTEFTIISSMKSTEKNFLRLPSPGLFGFKVLAHYSFQEDLHPHFQIEDTFSYNFPAWDNKINTTQITEKSAAVPEFTFISFHALPSLAPGYPGGGQFITVKNSALLESLAHGPLAKTLQAAESLTTQPESHKSFCLSIDPDLLITVNALGQGYTIANVTHPHSEIARNWLQRLRIVAKHRCVVSELFANVDINFIAHAQLADLYSSTVMGPNLLENILQTPVELGTIYTGQQVLGPEAVALMHSHGIHTLIGQTSEICPADMLCLPINFRNSIYPWKSHKPVESALDTVARMHLTMLRTQNTSQQIQQPIIIGIDPGFDAKSHTTRLLINAIEGYYATNQFSSQDPNKYLQSKTIPPFSSEISPASHTYFAQNNIRESHYFISNKSTVHSPFIVLNTLDTLFSLSQNTRDEKMATVFYSPLREDILRAYSVIGKIPGRAYLQRHTESAQREIRLTTLALTQISDQIQVLSPTTTYTLTSHKSPLILAIKNGLPLTIRVNVMVRAPQGFSVQNKDAVVIPPLSERQLKLPTYSAFSRYTSVLVQLQSNTGILLNTPVRISIYANAYGHWFMYIALIAGIILVLLLLRRLYMRLSSRNGLQNSQKSHPTPEQKRFTVSPLRLKRSAHASRFSDRDDF